MTTHFSSFEFVHTGSKTKFSQQVPEIKQMGQIKSKKKADETESRLSETEETKSRLNETEKNRRKSKTLVQGKTDAVVVMGE